ncbi:MAG: Coq4 family protein [Parvularculaceae bacterium]
MNVMESMNAVGESAAKTTDADGVELRFSKRMKPFAAVGAMANVLRNKEETSEVLRFIESLDGPAHERNFLKFKATETGARILRDRINIIDTLDDYDRLETLAPDSLGRTYLAFVKREGVSAGMLQAEMENSGEDLSHLDEDRVRYLYRVRQIHDIIHILGGYRRDLIGELAVMTFTGAQYGGKSFPILVGLLSARAKIDFHGLPVWGCMNEATRVAKAAKSVFNADWEAYMAKPMDEVRADMNFAVPTLYHSIADRSEARDLETREALLAARKKKPH